MSVYLQTDESASVGQIGACPKRRVGRGLTQCDERRPALLELDVLRVNLQTFRSMM